MSYFSGRNFSQSNNLKTVNPAFGLKVCVLLLPLLLAAGCSLTGPRPRVGYFPSSTIGSKYLNPDKMGSHDYTIGLGEKNGIVYTCRGGHIDISHLRIAADWTAYLTEKTYKHMLEGDTLFSFKLNVEPSRYHAQIVYPADWENKPQAEKEQIAGEISLKLGQYFTHNATNWHEMLTWFGFKCLLILPEFNSAFAWEDAFSNFLGTEIAVKALQDESRNYDQAVTWALKEELAMLGVQPKSVALRATNRMRGDWFSGDSFATSIRKRHFDIGLDDGMITPVLLPEFAECGKVEPISYPAPNLDFLSEYGFNVFFRIEPREWEKGRMLDIAYEGSAERENIIIPHVHFPKIIAYMKQDAARRYGAHLVEN